MIRDETEPNLTEESTPKPSNQSLVVVTNNDKKLISPDQLKQLSNLFTRKNE